MKQSIHPCIFFFQIPVILLFVVIALLFKKIVGPMSMDQQTVFISCTVIIWATQCYAMIISQGFFIDMISRCEGSYKNRYKID